MFFHNHCRQEFHVADEEDVYILAPDQQVGFAKEFGLDELLNDDRKASRGSRFNFVSLSEDVIDMLNSLPTDTKKEP